MTENEISKIVLDNAFMLHKKLGPGLLESIYQNVLEHELENAGLHVQVQKPIPFIWNEVRLDVGFRADLIIEKKVLVELKSIETIAPVHWKQVLTYLRICELKLGLLINFNEAYLKNGIKRIVNGL